MALVAFPEKLIILSISDLPFEESVPFKSKDLMGIGSHDYFFESEQQNQFDGLLFCSSAGILGLQVPNVKTKPEMQQ